jgi:16S rRNA (adenine1518-N6/adenine1519-N6)-dimethyltransferase
VVSALIEIRPVKDELPVDPENFKMFVRAGFKNRRKNLINNLKSSDIGIDEEKLKTVVQDRLGDIKIRAESLSVEDFVSLIMGLRGRF